MPAWRDTAGEPVMRHNPRAGQAAVSSQKRWRQAGAGTRQTTRHQGSLTGA